MGLNKRNIRKLLFYFIFFLLCIFLKLFVFEVYYIPSASMEDTLFKGDFILVNKLTSNLKKIKLFTIQNENSYTINRGDILVYKQKNKSVLTNKKIIVKRCIGLPGDTVTINNQSIFINGQNLKKILPELCLTSDNNYLNNRKQFIDTYISKTNNTRIIPYKGYTIKIENSLNNIAKSILFRDSDFNTKALSHSKKFNYTFLNNFYFVIGDNTNKSLDSRVKGPICRNQIIGKAIMVLFSWNNKEKGLSKLDLHRIFKTIK